jgi:hypothetical protein
VLVNADRNCVVATPEKFVVLIYTSPPLFKYALVSALVSTSPVVNVLTAMSES